tara:strand:- start:2969 stop:3925 length:957 start_codon:yes stop_codon:yes gene_type:complete
MKVIDHILKARKEKSVSYSMEIVPPPRGSSIKDITDQVKVIQPYDPKWIDVTSHASNAYYKEMPDGSIKKKIFRKRPGTLSICGVIQNRFKIDTIAHVLCKGFTKEETEDALIELNYLGIQNVLALQGDSPNYSKPKLKTEEQNEYAIDLVRQIVDLNKGQFLDELSNTAEFDFCIGVAGYPEKHFEAANLKTDIEYLKQKVDAGAEYIVTQMFFDNNAFHGFVDKCRDAGITVPIVPGLKILKSERQLKSLPKNFHMDIPTELADQVRKDPENAREIGKEWAVMQTKDLIQSGICNIHYYIMNDSKDVTEVIDRVSK